jgi:hypothetical protein
MNVQALVQDAPHQRPLARRRSRPTPFGSHDQDGHAKVRLPVNVTEIHHFPDARIADIFYQRAVDEALELHVAGEAQVRAIESRQLGEEMLESAPQLWS